MDRTELVSPKPRTDGFEQVTFSPYASWVWKRRYETLHEIIGY